LGFFGYNVPKGTDMKKLAILVLLCTVGCNSPEPGIQLACDQSALSTMYQVGYQVGYREAADIMIDDYLLFRFQIFMLQRELGDHRFMLDFVRSELKAEKHEEKIHD